MDAPAIFTMARELTNTNDTDYNNTRLLPFLNQVKNDLFSYLITWAWEDWNWDIWTTNSVVWQTEYVIPEAASDTEWNLKISSININYDWDTYDDWSLKYIRAKEINPAGLPNPWNYYTNNQNKEQPIYYIADQSIFVAPAPIDWAIANGIELKGIKSIVDYTILTTEPNIWIPLYLHDVLVQWLLPYIHRSEWRKDEASFEIKEYERKRDLAVNKFKNRATWPHFLNYPNEMTVKSDAYILDLT